MQGLLFELISGRTRWLAQRQAVLTQNVANADTPDYAARDLKPAGFRELLPRAASVGGAAALTVTQATHLAAPRGAAAEHRARRVESFETSPAGNGVVLDEQLRKLAETQLDYELATNLYRRQVGLVKTAIGTAQA